MMVAINISELQSNLLKYLKRASAGEHVSVTFNGKVVATISAPEEPKAQARERLHALARTAKLHDTVCPPKADWNASLVDTF